MPLVNNTNKQYYDLLMDLIDKIPALKEFRIAYTIGLNYHLIGPPISGTTVPQRIMPLEISIIALSHYEKDVRKAAAVAGLMVYYMMVDKLHPFLYLKDYLNLKDL